jgi:hypothetical protein
VRDDGPVASPSYPTKASTAPVGVSHSPIKNTYQVTSGPAGLRERLLVTRARLVEMDRPGSGQGVSLPGRVVPVVSLVPDGWCAGSEDGSECGALGVGQGWSLSHEVLNVRGEAVRARPR